MTRRLLGRPLASGALNAALLDAARDLRPDVVLIGKGAYLTPHTLATIKREVGATLVNWAADDPFNRANATRSLIASIPLYDLYVCTKQAVVADVARAGAAGAAYLKFGYKPDVHYPERPASGDERARFESDVLFIGGCDADRAPYIERLLERLPGTRLHLYGARWDMYRRFRPYWRGNADGRGYRLAMGGTKIALNLVRRANRDDHVMRTFEIPACGAFMLAERTETHVQLFADGVEAAFFSTPAEMVEKIRYYLPRRDERMRIAEAGHLKVASGGHTYSDRLGEILGMVSQARTRNEPGVRRAASG
jgi:spore maturation protein CgeB